MTTTSNPPYPTASRPLSTPEGFVLGGVAASVAVTFSNPAEVAKTRLQLQGELVKGGGEKVYRNVFDVFAKTWRNEGIRGVQRGLTPAYAYQILLNGSRLGFYEPIRKATNQLVGLGAKEQNPVTSVFAGAASGVVGAVLGNPLFLIKARMQAYSPALPVGTQHYYKNSWDALKTIYQRERLRGFVRGVDAAMLRTSMGSSVQLPTYNWTKNQLVSRSILPADSIWTYLASSSVSGVCVLVMMQPADTTLTRMYNQPTTQLPNGMIVGTLYKSPLDCLWKTITTEGPLALYKGSTAHFLRIAPHTMITLTANDVIIGLYKRLRQGAVA
ncbi:oxaloacetate carrier [Russula compacta]|nr:oxaloacetate carrier [Russula compacta]